MKTKKVVKLLLLLFVTVIINSCENGTDGLIYFSCNKPTKYCYYFTSYDDNNPDFPVGGAFNTFFKCSPGTYSYDYYVSSSCPYTPYHCTGSYTLYSNKGQKWDALSYGVLQNGKSGTDKHYNLNCEFSGGSLTSYKLIQQKPIDFDTTYVVNGNRMRVTGHIVFGEQPPKNSKAKYKLE